MIEHLLMGISVGIAFVIYNSKWLDKLAHEVYKKEKWSEE